MALTDNLVSVWELTEASGNALDSYGSNTLTDNATVGSAAGKIIGSRDFERNNAESFSCADNASLSIGSATSFGFSVWLNPESSNAAAGIVGKNTGSEYRMYTLSLTPNFELPGGTLAAGSSLSLATWTHLLFTYDAVADQMAIYINNGTPATKSNSTGPADSTADFFIGTTGATYLNQWDGLMEQVAFWKGGFPNSADRAALYNGGSGLAYSSWAGGGGAASKLIGGSLIGGRLTRGVLIG